MTSDRYAWRQNPGVGKYIEAVCGRKEKEEKVIKGRNVRREGGEREKCKERRRRKGERDK